MEQNVLLSARRYMPAFSGNPERTQACFCHPPCTANVWAVTARANLYAIGKTIWALPDAVPTQKTYAHLLYRQSTLVITGNSALVGRRNCT